MQGKKEEEGEGEEIENSSLLPVHQSASSAELIPRCGPHFKCKVDYFIQVQTRKAQPCRGFIDIVAETTTAPFRTKNPRDINVLVAGCTGSIGKFVVRELVKRGFNFIAVARERSGVRGRNGKEETLNELKGANICFLNVMSLDLLGKSVESLGSQPNSMSWCVALRAD